MSGRGVMVVGIVLAPLLAVSVPAIRGRLVAATRLHYKCRPRTPVPFDRRTTGVFEHRTAVFGPRTLRNARERSRERGCVYSVFQCLRLWAESPVACGNTSCTSSGSASCSVRATAPRSWNLRAWGITLRRKELAPLL